ncbi:hypothetical protein Tco_1306858 [Tanacetum coccineum]
MSSDIASSAVTYTSLSFDSNRPSWGISLVNAGELPEMDPYEEVAQQGQTPPLLPAYVHDPMELDEHVPPEDDDEDSKKDPEEDHTDYPADEKAGDDEPSNDNDDDDDTDDENEEPTKDEKEEKHLALADSSTVLVVDHVPSDGDTKAFETDEAQKTIKLEPPMFASMETCIAEHAAAPIPPTSPSYDQAPLGHRAAMIRMRDDILEEDMPPQRRFVLTAPPPGCNVAESSATAARPPRGHYDFVDVGIQSFYT